VISMPWWELLLVFLVVNMASDFANGFFGALLGLKRCSLCGRRRRQTVHLAMTLKVMASSAIIDWRICPGCKSNGRLTESLRTLGETLTSTIGPVSIKRGREYEDGPIHYANDGRTDHA
jgi:hypothetical protein